MDDSELLPIVENEIITNTQDTTLWRKALSLMNNDEEKAKEKYIKLRILQLKRDGYQSEKTEVDEPEFKETKPQEVSSQEKGNYSENIVVEKDDLKNIEDNHNPGIDKYINHHKKALVSLVLVAIGVSLFIWFIKHNQSNSITDSHKNESKVKKTKVDNLTIDEYVSDSDLMHELELRIEKEKEIKELKTKREQEEADRAMYEAIKEMEEEE